MQIYFPIYRLNNPIHLRVVIAALLLLCICNVNAFDKDYFDMSISELMEVKVTSSTKSPLKIHKAPGTIRLITRSEIDNLGYKTLSEVLMTIPGIQVDISRNTHSLIWIRGVQGRYNNKVLLFIDGVPIKDGYYDHVMADENRFLDYIDSIEVINGPGSLLYGANGFSGVINLKTVSNLNRASVWLGPDSTYSTSVQYSNNHFSMYGNVYTSDGFSPSVNKDGSSYEHDQQTDGYQLFMKYKLEGWEFIGNLSSFDFPYRYRNAFQEFRAVREPNYFSIKYDKNWENKSLNFQVYYSEYGMLLDRTDFTPQLAIKKSTREDLTIPLFGLEVAYQLALENHQLSLGISLLEDDASELRIQNRVTGELEPNLADDDAKKRSVGLYLQDLWTLSDDLLATYGVRYDRLSEFDNQWSYRLALTYSFNASWYGKIQVGTAYHVPSYREFLDVTAFNLQLAPEKLTTYELQAGYRGSGLDFNIIFYQNDYRDFIKDLYVESVIEEDLERIVDDEVAFNADNRSINGVEVNSKFEINNKFNVSIGASHLFNANETIGLIDSKNYIVGSDYVSSKTNLNYLSRDYVNVGLIYKTEKGTAALNIAYYSSRNVSPNYQQKIPDEQKTLNNVDGYIRADFNYKYSLNAWEFNVKIKNLLDEDIFSQQFGGDSGFDHPWPGRQVFVTAKYSWH